MRLVESLLKSTIHLTNCLALRGLLFRTEEWISAGPQIDKEDTLISLALSIKVVTSYSPVHQPIFKYSNDIILPKLCMEGI